MPMSTGSTSYQQALSAEPARPELAQHHYDSPFSAWKDIRGLLRKLVRSWTSFACMRPSERIVGPFSSAPLRGHLQNKWSRRSVSGGPQSEMASVGAPGTTSTTWRGPRQHKQGVSASKTSIAFVPHYRRRAAVPSAHGIRMPMPPSPPTKPIGECAACGKAVLSILIFFAFYNFLKHRERRRQARRPEQRPIVIGPCLEKCIGFQGTPAALFLRPTKPYSPPDQVAGRVADICASSNVPSQRSHVFASTEEKFKLLDACFRDFKHAVPNSQLCEITTIDEVITFYETPVDTTVPLDALKSMQLPENLHVQHEYLRFHPETDTMFGGKTAFPKSSTLVTGLKYRGKYRGHEAKRSWP